MFASHAGLGGCPQIPFPVRLVAVLGEADGPSHGWIFG